MDLSINKLVQEATTAHQAGRLTEAEDLYKKVLEIEPIHPVVLNNLGYIKQYKGELDEAMVYFRKIKETEGNDYSKLYANMGTTLVKLRKHDEAEKYLRKAIEHDPGNAYYHTKLSDALKTNGKLEEAEISYKKLIELDPKASNAFNNLGNVLRSLNKFKEAELIYTEAIRLKPKFHQAYSNLGLLLMNIDRLADALKCYKIALQLKPDFVEAHNNLGNIYLKVNRLEEAERSYKKAIVLKPDLGLLHFNLGRALKGLNRLEEAERSYKKTIELTPNYSDAYNNLGGILFELGKLEEAEVVFKNAIILKPDNSEYLINFSMVLDYLNKQDEAILQLEKVSTLLTDEFGLKAKINLAIFKFLEDDFISSKKYLHASSNITEIFKPELKNHRIYHSYLTKILSLHKDKSSNIDKKIYVIGDSHVLGSHGICVSIEKNNFLCKSILIMGCTQWELGNLTTNKYKIKFESAIRSLPKVSKILLSIGEIDCRIDYGIIKYSEKYPEKNRSDLIKFTIENYLNYIHKINSLYQHKITIQGVPSPNVTQINAPKEKIKELNDLINDFNIFLKDKSVEMGFSFLDLYELTDNGDGSSNKIWHIDTHHLSHKAMLESWLLYLKK